MTVFSHRGAFSLEPHPLAVGRLRPVTDKEADELGRLCAGIDPYRRLNQSHTALTLYLKREDPALFRFAIEYEGAAVGVIAVRSPWLRGPFLEMLAIREDLRGLGLGRAAVDWVAGQAGLLASNLWTTVSDFNESARAFYARLGFQEVSELPGLVSDDASEFLLRRRLTRRAM